MYKVRELGSFCCVQKSLFFERFRKKGSSNPLPGGKKV